MEWTPTAYLDEVKARLVSSTAVHSFQILKERVTPVNGYIRVRITLRNGDLLEATEYFEQGVEGPKTVDYRYHWIDHEKRLRRRWDSAPHHPAVPSFPHHVHERNEENVHGGHALSLLEVLALIEAELSGP